MRLSFDNIWPYVWSFGLIATGVYYIKKRKIAFGIKGRPTKFYLKGVYAIIVSLISIIIGVLILFHSEVMGSA